MPLHLLVKWEVVSPNSREGQFESISIISSIPLFSDLVSQMWGWFGGGGVMFFSHFMLFPQKNCMLEILYSAPSLTATG